jgi:hypothetical protein
MLKKGILLLPLATAFVVGFAWAQGQQPVSLGELARRVRADRAKRDLSKVPVFTNDNLPTGSPLSVVGVLASGGTGASAAPSGTGAAAGSGGEEKAPGTGAGTEQGESYWRKRFADARAKITEAEQQLDILQREHNLARVQYYQDPDRAMREQYAGNTAGGRELMQLQEKINAKQTEVERLRQDLTKLEDDLRRSGGEPGWAR